MSRYTIGADPADQLVSATSGLPPGVVGYDNDGVPNLEMARIGVPKEVSSYSWGAADFKGSVYCYLIDSWVEAYAQDSLVLKTGGSWAFEYAPGLFKSVPMHSHSRVFVWNSKIYALDIENETCTIKGNGDISQLQRSIDTYIEENNPYKGKLLEVKLDYGVIVCKMKPSQEVAFEDVILPKQLKQDIYDNTIYNMRMLDGNNGVILYGPPGTGKSLLCKAISWELTKDDVASLIVSSAIDFSKLRSFVEFVGPSVVFLEDADSYAFTRNGSDANNVLAEFLQFINGISEMPEKILFVATTNYLDKLDDAVANRPMRFNRKFKVDIPSDDEITQLVHLYFGKEGFSPEKCFGKNFTGSHIQELYRTAQLLAAKNGSCLELAYREAIDLVAQHFSPTLSETGFRPS